MRKKIKAIFRTSIVAFLGFLVGVALVYVYQMRNRTDLHIWHQADLDKEVTASDINKMSTLKDYIKREELLFEQLDELVYNQVSKSEEYNLNRYIRGSWSDPNRFNLNWNRTIELPVKDPKAGVLMLHGLSDSPYSMRSLAIGLQKQNGWVVALRLPGHGTAPVGLVHVQWRDFTAAVRLAARDLVGKIGPDVPLYIVGYSNGAALALEYTLSGMLGEKLRKPAGLVLISPAVSFSRIVSLAGLNLYPAQIPGLEKLGWLSIEPEYDPYKYNSFAINAGEQIYKLTRQINKQLNKLDKGNSVKHFPPVLALQSVVDATIPPQALIDNLMNRLSPNGHQLVLFDINRVAAGMILLKNDMQRTIEKMMTQILPFTFSVVTNRDSKTRDVKVEEKTAMKSGVSEKDLDLSWPVGVYSLSHVALPFSATDPLYGGGIPGKTDYFTLGSLEVRGEKDVLQIPDSNLTRMRYNPFYNYLERQIQYWVFNDGELKIP